MMVFMNDTLTEGQRRTLAARQTRKRLALERRLNQIADELRGHGWEVVPPGLVKAESGEQAV